MAFGRRPDDRIVEHQCREVFRPNPPGGIRKMLTLGMLNGSVLLVPDPGRLIEKTRVCIPAWSNQPAGFHVTNLH